MKDTNQIIQEVLQRKFKTLLYEELNLKSVLFQILTEGTAYIIGGYVRDVLENKENRDLDIVVDIPNERLRNIVESENCEKRYNRMGGAKLILKNINVDIWSFDNNWAFKNGLVKLNEKEKLNSLAKGCFYNYDGQFYYRKRLFTSCKKFIFGFENKRIVFIGLWIYRRSDNR